MKTLSIVALAMLSVSSASADLNDTSYLIRNPVHPGGGNVRITFDYWSQESGVCKALGYEKAAEKSTRFDDDSLDLIVHLNADGMIESGGAGKPVNQIVCLNKVDTITPEKIAVVESPTHPESDLALSFEYWSQEIGLCRALGYTGVAPKSTRFGIRDVDALQVDDRGNVVSGKAAKPVTRAICLYR